MCSSSHRLAECETDLLLVYLQIVNRILAFISGRLSEENCLRAIETKPPGIDSGLINYLITFKYSHYLFNKTDYSVILSSNS